MKKLSLLAPVLIAAIGMTWVDLNVDAQQPADLRSGSKRWEYKVVLLSEMFPNQIPRRKGFLQETLTAEFGDEGWQLCGVDDTRYFFKRPK